MIKESEITPVDCEFDPNLKELPQYIGYGKLDKQSIEIINDKIYGEYYFYDRLVYKVEWGERCVLQDVFEEDQIISSYGKNVRQTFMQNWEHIYFFRERLFEPRLQYLLNIINENLVNFKFHDVLPNRNLTVFYPAGICFEIIIPNKCLNSINALIELQNQHCDLINFIEQKELYEFYFNANNQFILNKINVIAISVNLAYLFDALMILLSIDVVPFEKRNSIIIKNVLETLNKPFYVGKSKYNENYKYYGYIYEEYFENTSAEKLKKQFNDDVIGIQLLYLSVQQKEKD
jgi:hypothetical protein